MWEYQHSIDTDTRPEAIWRLFADVQGWTRWNAGIARIEILGPFVSGTEILMTPVGMDPVRMRLGDVRPNELFIDETPLDGVLVRVEHRIQRIADNQTRVTYHMRITGPSADSIGPELGPAISGDFPEVMAALASLASRKG
jgi:uncharacterized protein YndB with AHSA1/START domain